MVSFDAKSAITTPTGLYSGTEGSAVAKFYRTLATSSNPSSFRAENYRTTDFARAVYGDGPYSLLRPNNTSDIKAINIDYVA